MNDEPRVWKKFLTQSTDVLDDSFMSWCLQRDEEGLSVGLNITGQRGGSLIFRWDIPMEDPDSAGARAALETVNALQTGLFALEDALRRCLDITGKG